MRTTKYRIWILFFALCCGLVVNAQEFYAQASAGRVKLGESFVYTLTLDTKADSFTPPDFKDFEIVSGPEQSTTMKISNGVSLQATVITYKLSAKRQGTLVIGAAKARAGSLHLETKPVSIEVKGAAFKPEESVK